MTVMNLEQEEVKGITPIPEKTSVVSSIKESATPNSDLEQQVQQITDSTQSIELSEPEPDPILVGEEDNEPQQKPLNESTLDNNVKLNPEACMTKKPEPFPVETFFKAPDGCNIYYRMWKVNIDV